MAVERLEAAQSAHGAMTVVGVQGGLLTQSVGRGCGTLHAFRILVAGERLVAQ